MTDYSQWLREPSSPPPKKLPPAGTVILEGDQISIVRDASALKASEFAAQDRNVSPAALEAANRYGMSAEMATAAGLDKPKVDHEKLARENPKVAQWLKNPDNYAMARDNIEDMSYLERQLAFIGEKWEEGNRTVEMANRGEKLFREIWFSEPVDAANRARIAELRARQTKDYGITGFWEDIPGVISNQIPIQFQTLLGSARATAVGAASGAAVGAGIGSLAGGVGAIPGAATGSALGAGVGWRYGAGVAAARMEGSLALVEYMAEMDDAGVRTIDDETAAAAAFAVGLVNGGLEMLGVEQIIARIPQVKMLSRSGVKELLKSPTTRAVFARFGKAVGQAMVTEGITEFLQEMVTHTGKVLAEGNASTPDELLAQILDPEAVARAIEAGEMGMKAGGGMAVVAAAPEAVAGYVDARRAEQVRQAWIQTGERLKKVPLAKQGPLEEMAQGAPNVFIPSDQWNVYWQSQGVDPREVAQEVLGSTKAYDDAVAAGADIPIPTAAYARKIAATEHNAFFAEELRMSPDQLSAREMKEQIKNLDALAEADNDEVLEELTKRLRGAGFDAQTSDDYASQMAAALTQLSKRSGIMTPMQTLQKYGLDVTRAGLPVDVGASTMVDQSEAPATREQFIALGDAQRDMPEHKMIQVQRATGGGVLNGVIEHVGDLTHRMADRNTLDTFGYEFVKEKVEKTLRALTSRYEFDREFKENLQNNAKYWAGEGKKFVPGPWGGSLEALTAEVDKRLAEYAEAHAALPAYNDAQRLARDAAVALGKKDWWKAVDNLRELEKHLGSREEWVKFAGQNLQQTLDQGPLDAIEDAKWASWEPETTSTGKIKGAPEWMKKPADFKRLLKELRTRIDEGMLGRYWYENSARKVLQMVGGGVAEAEKFIQLLAIYSPQAGIMTNTIFAVRAWNHWKSGGSSETLKVKTGAQDAKAVDVLYNDVPFEGRKTNSFYLNLMHDIVAIPGALEKLKLDEDLVAMLDKPATIDLWMYRAFGYRRHMAGDDKGGTGRYSFAENTMRRIAAELNQQLAPGEPRWTPHQIQAAVWTAMKARYEIPAVKEATWRESLRKGYATLNEKGQRTAPTEPEARKQHDEIWRKHAMKVPSEVATEATRASSASFANFITQMTEIVTWEALPSTSLGLDINNASPEVKEEFTRAAYQLLLDENGNDMLAALVGAPLARVGLGVGAYSNTISPNVLSRILPTKGAGEFSRDEARAYAAAIQYIFKQDAVPWIRPDPRALDAKAAREEQLFRVITAEGKTRKTFEKLSEARAYVAANEGKGFEIIGGKYATALSFKLQNPLTLDGGTQLLQELQGAFGKDVGYTRLSPDEVIVVNFRDDRTGVPFVDDEEFLDSAQKLGDNSSLIKSARQIWSEGEYGPVHDWKGDPQGQALLDSGSLAGSPGLQSWVADRREAFERLIEDFSGRKLEGIGRAATLFQAGRDGQAAVRGDARLSAPPVRADGRVELVHWSRAAGVEQLDPAYHGRGIAGAESTRKTNDARNWVDRTYYGLGVGQPGGYVKEAALGAQRYVASVDPSELYDWVADPDGIKPTLTEVGASKVTEYEKRIRDAGYKGYWVAHPQLGLTAAVFEALPVETQGVVEEMAQSVDQTSTPEFKAWFGDSKVVDENGAPLVVYHGTTGDFDSFSTRKANVESDWGAGIYFSNAQEDVSENYAGEGPDLTNKIERLAEQFMQDADEDYTAEQARADAKEQLSVQHGGMAMPVYLKMENPVYVGGPNDTFFDYELVEDENGDIVEEKGSLLDLVEALREEASAYDGGSVDNFIDRLLEDGEVRASELQSMLEKSEETGYFVDDNGALVSKEILRAALERMGFDGIIDFTVDRKFGTGRRGFGGARVLGMAGMDENTVHYIAFKPTQIKSAVGNRGTFDPNDTNILNQTRRGYIQIAPNRTLSIGLLENADLSTFIHESGHAYLEIFRDLVAQLRTLPADELTESQKQMLDDADTITKWMGIKSLDEVQVEHHEQWARGFEAYAMEGKSPSVALRRAFARFRTWLVALYRSITGLNVKLNDDVRAVFDRMLASDEEIEAARNETAALPAFTDAVSAGMSEREFAVYKRKVEDASNAARENLERKLMDEYTREREAWWQERKAEVQETVEQELIQRREYAAREVLRKGKTPAGEPVPKLNTTWVRENRPEMAAALKPYTRKDGATPTELAPLFGFASGDELLDALVDANLLPYRQAVEAETQRRMLAQYGDMRNDGTLADKAKQAVLDDHRSEIIEEELKAIEKLRRQAAPVVEAQRKDRAEAKRKGVAMLRSIPSVEVIRRVARGRVEQTQLKDLQPGQWLVAARKASAAAQKAIIEEDYHTAALQKQRELLSVEMYREVNKARERADNSIAYLRSMQRPKVRGPIAKAGQGILAQIDDLVAGIDLSRPRRPQGAFSASAFSSYEEFLASMQAAGQPVNDDILRPAQTIKGRPYRDLTVEELYGLRDAVKHLQTLARFKNKLLRLQTKAELDATAAELESTAARTSRGKRPVRIETELPQGRAAKWLSGFLASMRKMSSLAREMDGGVDGGPFWEALIQPLTEAADREMTMRMEAAQKLQELLSPYLTLPYRVGAKVLTLTQGLAGSGMFREEFIPAIGMRLSKQGRLMVALNWGNDLNRMRLMDGYGWNEAQVEAILDGLTEQDWQVVQGIWDLIDSFWPEIKGLAERIDGVAPEKVEAAPVQTKYGEMRGGYFPLKYNAELSPRAHELNAKEQAEAAMRGAGMRSTTKHGFRKERVQASLGKEMKVRLDLGAVHSHLNDVIHDLTHYEALIDVNRVMKHPATRRAFNDYYGHDAYTQFERGLMDVAAGDVGATSSFERAINHLRTGVSISAMGFNFMTSIIQPLGFTQSIVRIGPKWVWKGITRWMRDTASFENAAAVIRSKSPFMQERSRTMIREINEVRSKMEGDIGLVAAAFWPIAKMQQIVDVPTWLGAYEKAYGTDVDMTEERAVAIADQAVRDSQGGGQVIDLAQIQRGSPLMKLWTNFYSFFNVTYNLASESVAQVRSVRDVPKLVSDFLMLYTVPAVLGYLLTEALRGDLGDEPDDLAMKLLQAQLAYIFGTVVGLRELGGAVQGYAGYEGPAGARGFAELAGLAKQVGQGEVDEAAVKAAANAAGILLHFPATQTIRSVEGMIEYQKSDDATPLILLTGPERNR